VHRSTFDAELRGKVNFPRLGPSRIDGEFKGVRIV